MILFEKPKLGTKVIIVSITKLELGMKKGWRGGVVVVGVNDPWGLGR